MSLTERCGAQDQKLRRSPKALLRFAAIIYDHYVAEAEQRGRHMSLVM